MWRVLIADDISEQGIQKLQMHPDVSVTIHTGLSEEELAEEIRDFDAILVRSQTKVTAKVIECAPKLRVIGRAGVGVDNIDVPTATRCGVLVLNAPDGNTISAAEHTFAMLISLARHIPQAHESIQHGQWDRKSFVGVELRGKTLSVLGMGRIGTEVAKRANAFGMRVIGYDPFLREERANAIGVERMDLEPALAHADFITVHTPLTKDTRHMLDKEAFHTMKRGVRIVNCARGGIIDECALRDALDAGVVAGAALDVFEVEPLTKESPLLNLPNVILTPHLGASTVDAQINVAIDVAEEVGRVLQGLPFHNAVNLPSLSAEQQHQIEPFLELGEKLGLFAAQMIGEAPSILEITYVGELADTDVSFLTRTILKGLLGYRYADEVNYVNALFVCDQVGLTIREVKQPKGKVFTNLITLSLISERSQHHASGTLYNGSGPRIVDIDGYAVDAPIQGKMVFTRHIDKPGMIGRIGTILGDRDINIAAMQVGRRQTGGEAVMLLSVDKVVPDEVVTDLANVLGIQLVRAIEL